MRLIDANELYERIAEKEELARQRLVDTPSRLPNGSFNPYATRYATQLDERTTFKFMIADAPTIEAETIKHGRWIEQNNHDWEYSKEYRCSECGKHRLVTIPKGWNWNFCPYCGAKMDEVESEGNTETLEAWNLDGTPTRYVKVRKDEANNG